MLEAIVLVVFPFCMVFAAVSDLLSMTIANRVSVLLLATFAIAAPMIGMDWAQIGLHLAAGVLVLAVTFALFAFGGMGGGDAKLMAATAIWFGFSPILIQYFLTAALLGGALTLLILKFRNSYIGYVSVNNVLLRNLADHKAGIPYGIALGTAGLFAYPETPFVQWALASLAGV